MKPVKIKTDKCTLCGLCINQCSSKKLILQDNEIIITQNDCIGCGHCYAICPQEAILTESNEHFIPANQLKINPSQFQNFLRSRRSHRLYQNKPISDNDIQSLIDFAHYAPTGSNAQGMKYLFVKSPDKIQYIRQEIMKVYSRFNKLIHNPVIRFLISLFDSRAKKKELRDSLANMMERYNNGQDPLFHNAPLVVFAYSKKSETSTPKDDACYGIYNMVLGAETLGLSSCINGLAIIALSQNKKLRKYLGFTKGNKAFACCGFGYPLHNYKNLVFRKKPDVKVL